MKSSIFCLLPLTLLLGTDYQRHLTIFNINSHISIIIVYWNKFTLDFFMSQTKIPWIGYLTPSWFWTNNGIFDMYLPSPHCLVYGYHLTILNHFQRQCTFWFCITTVFSFNIINRTVNIHSSIVFLVVVAGGILLTHPILIYTNV